MIETVIILQTHRDGCNSSICQVQKAIKKEIGARNTENSFDISVGCALVVMIWLIISHTNVIIMLILLRS